MEGMMKQSMGECISEPGEGRLLIKEDPDDTQPLDFSKQSPPVMSKAEEEALRKLSHDSGISVTSVTSVNDEQIADDPEQLDRTDPAQLIGEPRISLPGMTSLPGMAAVAAAGNVSSSMANMNMASANMASLAGMGMFPGMSPGFPSPFMPPGFNPMWHNQMAAAAMMQQQQEAARKVLQTSTANGNNKVSTASRPFKQYPKDPLNFSLCSMPGLLPGASAGVFSNGMVPDPSALADALKSHEQMFTAYKQQVLSQKAADDAKKHARKNSIPTSSSPALVQPNPDRTSPPSSHVNGYNHLTSLSASATPVPSINENSTSSFAEDDKHSIASGKSSVNGDTPQISNSSEENSHNGHHVSSTSLADLTSHLPKRKNGITAGLPPTVTSSDSGGNQESSPLSPISSTTSNGPSTPSSTAPTGRKRSRTLPDDQKVGQSSKDGAYWERRRKNNEAAKRSRDTRRAKEDEIAIRAAFLEQENLRLRVELAALRQQTAKLRSELVMYQSPDEQARAADKTPADGS